MIIAMRRMVTLKTPITRITYCYEYHDNSDVVYNNPGNSMQPL